jgi:histidine triad (HIT) family protein
MSDCIFCRIANHEIPAEPVIESDRGFVFPDLNPQAPIHLLVVPKTHYANAEEAAREDEGLVGHLIGLAAQAARAKGLLPDGYRIVSNTGPDAGQSVPHLHFHVLGGRVMGWPPG